GGGKTSMRVRLLPETGQLDVLTGMVDQGAGAHTLIRRVMATTMSVAPERILVRYGDTATAPVDPGAGGSRVTHVIGQAALDGGQRMKAALEELAAEAYGWRAGTVHLEGDRFVSGDDAVGFDDVAARIGGPGSPTGSPVEVIGEYGGGAHSDAGDFN